MHCGVVEEEDDIISSSSGSSSVSPSDRHRANGHSLHSPLSLTASTTTSLSTDSNHHSPAASNSSHCSFLIRELEAPSGLNLLVAALDAQNPHAFRSQQQQVPDDTHFDTSLIVDEDSLHHPTSDEDTGSEKKSNRRKSTVPHTCKDETYWEKRRRNNEAAKRSREKRRINDMAMEARLMELSRENSLLKHELDSTKKRRLPTPTPAPSHLLVPTVPDTPPLLNPVPEIAAQVGAISPHRSSLATSAAAAAHLAAMGATRSPFLPNAAGLAAAGLMNPLLAMVSPSMLLQAAIAQQHQHQRPSQSPSVTAMANGKRLSAFSTTDPSVLNAHQPTVPPFGSDQRQQSVAAPSILTAALSAPTSPGPPTASSFSDGKQYLRYKLLERQLQQQSASGFTATPHGLNLLGSVISGSGNGSKPSSQRSNSISLQPPPSKRQRTMPPAVSVKAAIADSIRADADTSLSLKECLSSLAVSLISPGAYPSSAHEDNGCDTTRRSSLHSSPVGPGENQQNGNQSAMFDDNISRIGDLLRARTHSDSSQSSAGIISHGSSTSTTASVGGAGTVSPGTMMEMEFRNTLSDRRRDSNNSDSGIMSDGLSDRRLSTSSYGKRYRNDHERYVERRRRNNEAAKRCRANRRAMFEYRYQRAQELENENARLKDEMRQLSRELSELKELLATRGGNLCNDYVLQTVNKDRDILEAARLKNLMNTNELDDENREGKLSIVDEIKEEDSVPDEVVARNDRLEETPLDFTIKKEKV